MLCPNCNLSLQKVQDAAAWWCPRCGTLVKVSGQIETPKLVDWAREFNKAINPKRSTVDEKGKEA